MRCEDGNSRTLRLEPIDLQENSRHLSDVADLSAVGALRRGEQSASMNELFLRGATFEPSSTDQRGEQYVPSRRHGLYRITTAPCAITDSGQQ